MLQGFLDNIGPILALIVGFGFLIFVHELGHFVVAKWVGIRCTQFAIGFGHSLLTYRKGLGLRVGTTEGAYEKRAAEQLQRDGVSMEGLNEQQQAMKLYQAADKLGLGETEYRLNWMPLGGYVKMLGQEDLDPAARSNDPRSFNSKPVWARACVISAGVVMNLIFGLIFFIIAFMAGVEFPPAIVGQAATGSPAATAFAQGHADDEAFQGLRPGDEILAIDGEPVTDFMDVVVATALASPDIPLTLTIRREGIDEPLQFVMQPVAANDATRGRLLTIGVIPPLSLELGEPETGQRFLPELEAAGVRPGMHAVAIDERPIQRYDQFNEAFMQSNGRPQVVRFADPAEGRTVDVQLHPTPLLATDGIQERNLLGLLPLMKVEGVASKSPAMRAGLQSGDVFLQIDGARHPDIPRGRQAIQGAVGRSIPLRVLRDGEEISLGPVAPNDRGQLGFTLGFAWELPIIGETLEKSPVSELELAPGTRIVSINGQEVANWADMQRLLREHAAEHPEGGQVALRYERPIAGRPQGQATITFDAGQAAMLMAAEWDHPVRLFLPLRVPVAAEGPIAASLLGIKKTRQFMVQTYLTLYRLFQGTVPVSELRGPVGIVDAGAQTARQGWTYLMFFLGLISVNLVVINFLPIPIVDGGLMVFLIIEKLKGSPVSPQVQTAATFVGLALIATVMLMTLYFDVARLLPS